MTDGQAVVITGTSEKGLGAKTATTIAIAKPAHLVLLARSKSKVQPVIDQIGKISPESKATFVPILLDDLVSVRSAADEVIKVLGGSGAKIDILINNAGIMAVPFAKSKQGFESQFAVNHLGHFVLTQKLIPLIKAAGPNARVVNLTSDGYRVGPFRPDNINFDDGKTYHPFLSYAQSKTANILFTKGLARRGINSLAVHPGVIYGTSLGEGLDWTIIESLGDLAKRETGENFPFEAPKSIAQGVATTVLAAAEPELLSQSGSFMADCQVEEARPWARDPAMVERLWEKSEELAGEKFVV